MPAENDSIRLLIVDDSAVFRQALRRVIGSADGLTVVGEAESGDQALELIAASGPHVVLMDAHMPRMTGADCTRQIKALAPRTVVIAVSVYDEDTLRNSMREAGADCFLSKFDLAGLIPTIRSLVPAAAAAT